MKNLFKTLIFFSLLACFLPSYIYAGLADSYGFSAAGIGRAGTFVARAHGWAATFDNIGGVSLNNPLNLKRILREEKRLTKLPKTKDKTKDKTKNIHFNDEGVQGNLSPLLFSESSRAISEIGLAYIYQITDGKINPDIGNNRTKKQRNQILKNIAAAENGLSYGILQLGMSVDLRPIVAAPYNTPIKLGLALTVRDNGSLASINDVNPSSYNFLRYGREAETITVITGVSFQLWKDRLSVGVGGNLGLTGNATFNILDVQLKTDGLQLPGHEFKADVRPDFSAVVGFVYIQPIAPSHEIRFGGSYKQETKVSVGPVSGLATVQALDIPIGLTLSLLDFYIPNIYSVGLSYRLVFSDSDIVISYDQEYQEWSRVSSSSSKILFFNNKQIVLPGLNDILISKGSVEYQPIDWPFELRGGYAYRPSFAPEQSGLTNFLDNSRHILAFGFSILFDANFMLKNRSKLNFGVQYQKSSLRSVTKNKDNNSVITTLQPDYTYSSDVLVFGADFVITF